MIEACQVEPQGAAALRPAGNLRPARRQTVSRRLCTGQPRLHPSCRPKAPPRCSTPGRQLAQARLRCLHRSQSTPCAKPSSLSATGPSATSAEVSKEKVFDRNDLDLAAQLSEECLIFMYRLLFLFYLRPARSLGYAPHPGRGLPSKGCARSTCAIWKSCRCRRRKPRTAPASTIPSGSCSTCSGRAFRKPAPRATARAYRRAGQWLPASPPAAGPPVRSRAAEDRAR